MYLTSTFYLGSSFHIQYYAICSSNHQIFSDVVHAAIIVDCRHVTLLVYDIMSPTLWLTYLNRINFSEVTIMLIVIYFAVSLIMSDALHVFLSSFQWHDRTQFML